MDPDLFMVNRFLAAGGRVRVRLPGQMQSKDGPRPAIGELQVASVLPRDRGAEGEPEARATGVPSSGAVRARETLEEVVAVLEGHAAAPVGDLEVPTRIGGIGAELYGSAFRRVAER